MRGRKVSWFSFTTMVCPVCICRRLILGSSYAAPVLVSLAVPALEVQCTSPHKQHSDVEPRPLLYLRDYPQRDERRMAFPVSWISSPPSLVTHRTAGHVRYSQPEGCTRGRSDAHTRSMAKSLLGPYEDAVWFYLSVIGLEGRGVAFVYLCILGVNEVLRMSALDADFYICLTSLLFSLWGVVLKLPA